MMKKLVVLLMVLGAVSVANATIIDVVGVDIGQSSGRTGTVGNPLHSSDTIGLKIILNHNPYPGYPNYDGYLLSSMDLDLHVVGPGSMDVGTIDKNDDPVWQYNSGLSPFGVVDDGDISNGLDQFSGVALTPIDGSGDGDLMWDLLLHCDGEGIVTLDLTLNGLSDYAPYKDLSGNPFYADGDIRNGTWTAMVEGDLGDLVIYQVIPEPMTLALLGLGGLFLRRRK